jgi:hypothetical protein
MKKILPLVVASLFIFSCFGASAVSIFNINESIEWGQKVILSTSGTDELDQYQPEMDFFAPVGRIFLAPDLNYITAQSFIPTKNVLTRVEIMVGKNSTTTYDFNLAIRVNLLGADLTSLSLGAENFPTEDFGWVEFDFNDIPVTPGTTYYIVSSTTNATDNWYAIGAKLTDVYPYGDVWFSIDDGSLWEEEPTGDLTFATYGLNNTAPGTPTITGSNKGKPKTEYNFTLVTIDLEADDVYYYVDWGDDKVSDWDGPYASEMEVICSHSWDEKGTYLIKAKAKDVYNAESDWFEFEVTIPRNRATHNSLFQWFLERFPLLERLLSLFR